MSRRPQTIIHNLGRSARREISTHKNHKHGRIAKKINELDNPINERKRHIRSCSHEDFVPQGLRYRVQRTRKPSDEHAQDVKLGKGTADEVEREDAADDEGGGYAAGDQAPYLHGSALGLRVVLEEYGEVSAEVPGQLVWFGAWV